jgi:SAM-dependent methyltransferase
MRSGATSWRTTFVSDPDSPPVTPSSGVPYDPERFWDAKALRSGGDFVQAACTDDADTNRCIGRIQRHMLKIALRFVRRRLDTRNARLLDFGCGSGRWAGFFTERGLRYSGVDISAEMLRLARARFPEASFSKIEGDRIPFPDRSFDIGCSIGVIHHNPYGRQQGIAVELSRVIRKGGYLVLFESVGARTSKGGIEYPRPIEDWRSMVADLGFRLELYRGTRYGILRWATEKLARRLRVGAGRGGPIWRTGGPKPWSQWLIDRLDAGLDPALGKVLPTRHHRRALMVFKNEV